MKLIETIAQTIATFGSRLAVVQVGRQYRKSLNSVASRAATREVDPHCPKVDRQEIKVDRQQLKVD